MLLVVRESIVILLGFVKIKLEKEKIVLEQHILFILEKQKKQLNPLT